jgi:hypothetical protein
MGRDLEGSRRDLSEISFRYLPGVTEDNHQKPRTEGQVSQPRVEPRTPIIKV